MTEIVHVALERYCALVESETSLTTLLEDSGFVACGEAPESLSTNYKDSLTEALTKKFRKKNAE